MKILLVLACVVLAVRMLWEMAKRRAAEAIAGMCGAEGDDCVTKHEQMAVLRSLDITLPSEDEEYQFLLHCSPEASEWFAGHPYWALLTAEGTVWNRVYSPGDAECIYGEDAYTPIFAGLARISGLPLENLSGTDRYYVEFTLAGKPVRFHARENRDWIDSGVGGFLNRQAERLLPRTSERFWLDDRHPAPIWLWATAERAAEVNRRTGLQFHRT